MVELKEFMSRKLKNIIKDFYFGCDGHLYQDDDFFYVVRNCELVPIMVIGEES